MDSRRPSDATYTKVSEPKASALGTYVKVLFVVPSRFADPMYTVPRLGAHVMRKVRQEGHREQALEPRSAKPARLAFRVSAHTHMGRRRRRSSACS